MKDILIAGSLSLVVSLLGTPAAIRILSGHGYGQLIRDDGPSAHHTKRGTPTMGGAVIILATWCGYIVASLVNPSGFTASGMLVMMLMTGLGVVGFLDDFIKIRNQRSLGLTKSTKLLGQLIVSLAFAVLALQFRNSHGLTPASTHISFVRDSAIGLGTLGFILWAYLMIAATSNGVNLSDGLDGLATGSCVMVFGAFVVINTWQFSNRCEVVAHNCYLARDPLDLAIVAASVTGACFGFLWWNASPAKIFMGDTGSLALGGALAGLAICSRTELLLLVLGGLFAVITLSVIIQVISFRGFGRRVFRMTPLHHHFEMLGWAEVTIVIRFWIIAGLAVAVGLGLFYANYLANAYLG